jgi:glycosyltransferase involved in cell wall biosynthesis
MNVFVVPSWYPSPSNPITGIFFREQAIAMAEKYSELNLGLSTWGQNDERLLLWSGKPVSSAGKLMKKPKSSVDKLKANLAEYFTPAYTWTSKFLDGNLSVIIQANIDNLEKFQNDFGKADLIHAHVGFPGGHIARKLSSTLRIPYIITEHMSPFPHRQFLKKDKVLDPRLLEAYKNATFNLCVSKSLEANMKSFGIENTRVIPNLVDEDFFYPASGKIKNQTFTFFSLGRMVPQKGIDLLLEAFAQIKADVALRIGGDGPLLNQYKRQSKDLGLHKKVQWLGELDKSAVLTEYQSSDAFILPSRHESMGLVFAEAMACGKPVIATICGGPEEFVNEDCGYLVDVENKKQLVEAIEQMVQNRNKFDESIIRKHCESTFSKKVVCKVIYDIYKQTID